MLRAVAFIVSIALLCAALPMGAIEGAYRFQLSRSGGLPQPADALSPRLEQAIWLELEGPLPARLEPIWPWTLPASYLRAILSANVPPRRGGALLLQRDAFLAQAHPVAVQVPAGGRLGPGRAWQRLALQIWMSRHWSAGEALAFWAENVYFGHGVAGLENASVTFAKKDLGKLDSEELARLLVLPRHPTLMLNHPIDWARARDELLDRFQAAQLYDAATIAAAKARPLPALVP